MPANSCIYTLENERNIKSLGCMHMKYVLRLCYVLIVNFFSWNWANLCKIVDLLELNFSGEELEHDPKEINCTGIALA